MLKLKSRFGINVFVFFLNQASNYWISTDNRTWRDALAMCKQLGRNLVSIHSEEEKYHIKILIKKSSSNFWIGLNDKSNETLFRWSDGSIFKYSDWAEMQPDNGAEWEEQDCVQMWREKEFKWDDDPCFKTKKYICGPPGKLFYS